MLTIDVLDNIAVRKIVSYTNNLDVGISSCKLCVKVMLTWKSKRLDGKPSVACTSDERVAKRSSQVIVKLLAFKLVKCESDACLNSIYEANSAWQVKLVLQCLLTLNEKPM